MVKSGKIIFSREIEKKQSQIATNFVCLRLINYVKSEKFHIFSNPAIVINQVIKYVIIKFITTIY